MDKCRGFGNSDFIDEPFASLAIVGFEIVDVSNCLLESIGYFPGELSASRVFADHSELNAIGHKNAAGQDPSESVWTSLPDSVVVIS
jgi:hypothetical protein